jgi:hypothetical protein
VLEEIVAVELKIGVEADARDVVQLSKVREAAPR